MLTKEKKVVCCKNMQGKIAVKVQWKDNFFNGVNIIENECFLFD